MSDGPQSYTLTMPGGGTVQTTIERYRGVLLSWITGDGAALRAFVDALPMDERLRLVGLQQDQRLSHGIHAMMGLWKQVPPQRFWVDGEPPQINGLYPTMHITEIDREEMQP